MSNMGLSAQMKPRLTKLKGPGKIFSFKLGKHRFAYTTDPGSVSSFQGTTFQTHLGARLLDPDGHVLDEYDLGAGKITGVGVLALAYDFFQSKEKAAAPNKQEFGPPVKAKEQFTTFATLRYHQWGTGGTEKDFNVKLATAATQKNTKSAAKAVEVESTVVSTTPLTGEEAKVKITSTSRIEAESSLAITEWGIFTEKELEQSIGGGKTAASGQTATLVKLENVTGTDSTEEARGFTQNIVQTENTAAEKVWGLIRKNTGAELTIPGLWLEANGNVSGTVAKASAVAKILPVMFDRRVFATINVESGNIIEFPWELTIVGGS